MKVAGTLGNYLDQKVNSKTGDLIDPTKKDDLDKSMMSTSSQVWDQELLKGVTGKARKNLKKKLQRQRKK